MVEILGTIPSLSGKVFESRVHPLAKEDLPCVIVKSGPQFVEDATKSHMQPGAIQRRLITTEVYVFARAPELVEDALDNLASLVENKVLENYTLNNVASKTTLIDTQSFITGEPNSPIGALLMNFLSLVYTREGATETPIRN